MFYRKSEREIVEANACLKFSKAYTAWLGISKRGYPAPGQIRPHNALLIGKWLKLVAIELWIEVIAVGV